MKKLTLALFVATTIVFTSCTDKLSTMSKNAVAFPGMTVSRADYKLSKDVSAEIEVKEFSALFGLIHHAKAVGENKHEIRQGVVFGFGLDLASQIAVYRLLDANPTFDYLTNIRITEEKTHKWLLFFHKGNTKIKIVAKGITLNTEK